MRVLCGVLGFLAASACVGCLLLTIGETGDIRDGGLIAAGLCAVVAAPFLVAWWKLRGRAARAAEGRAGRRRLSAPAGGEVLELGASRKRWGFALAVCAWLVAFGLWIVADGAESAWFLVVLFGVAGLAAGAQLVPGAAGLRLTAAGVQWRRFGRTTSYAWDDVDRFRTFIITTQYSTQELVGCDVLAGDAPKPSLLGRANKALSGVDVALPETYGRDAEELAELLQGWRDRHAARDRVPA